MSSRASANARLAPGGRFSLIASSAARRPRSRGRDFLSKTYVCASVFACAEPKAAVAFLSQTRQVAFAFVTHGDVAAKAATAARSDATASAATAPRRNA